MTCTCGKRATTLYTLRRPDGTLAGQIRTCDSCPVINLEWTKESLSPDRVRCSKCKVPFENPMQHTGCCDEPDCTGTAERY